MFCIEWIVSNKSDDMPARHVAYLPATNKDIADISYYEVSIAMCERCFSKLKMILSANVYEYRSSQWLWWLMSVERKCVEQIGYDKNIY